MSLTRQKLLEGFFRILEGLFELKALEPSFTVDHLIESATVKSFIKVPFCKCRPFPFVFQDDLIETRRLNFNLLTLELVCVNRDWWFLSFHRRIDISNSGIYSSGELILVINTQPSLNCVDHIRFENGCYWEL